MSNWVRESFYILPPEKDASIADWNKWLAEDKKKAIAAKKAFTKQSMPGELPQMYGEVIMRKINGVWKQTLNNGITGSAEDGSVGFEPLVEATQELDFDMARREVCPRGTSHVRSATEKRKLRRMRRMLKRKGIL